MFEKFSDVHIECLFCVLNGFVQRWLVPEKPPGPETCCHRIRPIFSRVTCYIIGLSFWIFVRSIVFVSGRSKVNCAPVYEDHVLFVCSRAFRECDLHLFMPSNTNEGFLFWFWMRLKRLHLKSPAATAIGIA